MRAWPSAAWSRHPNRPFVEATLADPLAAYIAMRTVTPGAASQGIPTLTHPTPAGAVACSRAERPFRESSSDEPEQVMATTGSDRRA